MPDGILSTQPDSVKSIAAPWYAAGCSTIPIRPNGLKKPMVDWLPYKSRRPTPDEMDAWFGRPGRGVAVICGEVSGDLEMLELEARATDQDSLSKVEAACVSADVIDVWEMLCHDGYSEWTPYGGLHLLYRMPGTKIPGNTKIALRFATSEELVSNPRDLYKVLAETRGEGGYVVVAPSPGTCHPSGEPWTTLAGSPATIPTITWEQRCTLHAAIRTALHQIPEQVRAPRAPVVIRDGLSPGDDYAQRTDWSELLEPQGWTFAYNHGEERMWVRPGKNPRDGISATTDYQGKSGLYVFSSSAGLPTEEPLSKLYVYAYYRHGGNLSAAAKDLAAQGFGDRAVVQSGWDGPIVARSAPVDVDVVADEVTGTVDQVVATVPPDLIHISHSDTGNGERLALMFGDRFRFVPVRNKWMAWDETVWVVDYRATLLTRATKRMAKETRRQAEANNDDTLAKHANKSLSAERISAAIRMLQSEECVYAEPDMFDPHTHLLNVGNGVVDLRTITLYPHQPQFMLTKRMNANFVPDAPCPRWDAYLARTIPDPELRNFTQRMVGYTLTGNPVQRALAILYGPGGTGKSRFVEILAALFGSYGTTAAESLFRSKRDATNGPTNDLNDLRGARLASVSELDYGIRMDEALVKRLTGLDRITSRGLYEENQTWMPQCVIWLATNHLPKINSDDGAIWDRMKVVPFKEVIADEDKDPHILDTLMTEADGILNWMLQGLFLYREQGLTSPTAVKQSVIEYQEEQDVVKQFLDDCSAEGRIVVDPDDKTFSILKTQLYGIFTEWCKQNMMQPLGQMRFANRMQAHGYERVKRSLWYWVGVKVGNHGVLGTM